MVTSGGDAGDSQKDYKIYELRVSSSGEQESITPPSNKRIILVGYQASMFVNSALTSTLRASLSFGTGGVSDRTKVIASYRLVAKDAANCVNMTDIYLKGEIDETLTLTNISFSVGGAVTRACVYYFFE